MMSNESNHDAMMCQSSNHTHNNGSHNEQLLSEEPDADAVLKFLRKRGLDAAFLQVQRHLETEEDASMGDERKKIKNNNHNNGTNNATRTSLYREEKEEEKEKTPEKEGEKEEKQNDADQSSSVLLVATTAAAAAAAAAVVPGTNDKDEHSTLEETHSTAATLVVESLPGRESQMDHTLREDRVLDSIDMQSRQEEARRCFKAFTAFQTWALNLPDDNSCTFDKIGNDGDNDGYDENKKDAVGCFLPGSIKPEVLHVTFPLFCYTYCNLLENHLERTASVLLSTFQHVHEPRYPMEFRDLEQCYKVEHVQNLKKLVMEARGCLSKMKASKTSCDECREQIHGSGGGSGSSSSSGRKDSIAKAMETLNAFETEYKESVNQYKVLTNRLKGFPFLSRALFMKCYLNISSTTFGYLVRYLRSDDMLLPMSLLLQSKCRVVVEKRRPLPFVPVCVLEDVINVNHDDDDDDDHGVTDPKPSVLKDIQWAAPMDPLARSNELGDLEVTVMKNGQSLPFPKFYLNREYETAKDYENEKRYVEFNRSLLTNGFRRLAALELKYDYECGLRGIVAPGGKEGESMGECGNPLEPSVLLSTLCTSFDLTKTDDSKIQLEEAGVDINCAKLSPVDGRFVAAGCSDSAVRIWSADSWESLSANGSIDTAGGAASTNPAVVLLGHKRGLPVFDLDWNRDGRTLISAGGDGSLRLWDTRAVGSVGETTRIARKEYMRQNGTKSNVSSSVRPITHVPGAKAESTAHRHGSALVCYQGHSPMTPVWSVSVAPCGYYFASAGADSTARLWCTDRKTPVRIFAGHSSENVNTVSWHPNCNYILTGSDDRTVRMWDIQSGKCVRLFNGCSEGVNQVKVSYSGLFVAGVDYSGIVHLWDVRNGKKLNEFRCSHSTVSGKNTPAPIVRSMCFSRCGTAIATGSDDCAIRIWDSRSLGNHCNGLNTAMHLYNEPNRIIRTKRTSVLDLHYTKQNLLLSVGKYFEI